MKNEGEQLPRRWQVAEELPSSLSSSSNEEAAVLPDNTDVVTISSEGENSASSLPSTASSPSQKRKSNSVVKHAIPSLCFTRKKKAIDGSINPVVTGLIVTPRKKKRVR